MFLSNNFWFDYENYEAMLYKSRFQTCVLVSDWLKLHFKIREYGVWVNWRIICAV